MLAVAKAPAISPKQKKRIKIKTKVSSGKLTASTKPMPNSETPSKKHHIDYIVVDGIRLRYLIREGSDNSTPLLLINGIGANLELCIPFIETLHEKEIIIFDIPGTGDSDTPRKIRRFKHLSKLANNLLDSLGYGEIDVAGVSWGGALAQQFAHQYPDRVRRLILAATTPGMFMVPAKLKVLRNMITPRRYISKGFMRKVSGTIYGGRIRRNPELVSELTSRIIPPRTRGYVYQLLAGLGWTSFHWLHTLSQPTLLLAGDDDPLVRPVNAKVMSLMIPNCRLEIVPGGGHLFLLHNAHAVTPIIRDFLNKPTPNLDALE